MSHDDLRKTPLYDRHVQLGGKMVPFAGFAMPVQYPTGITAEHRAVREACGIFDVSHMGEFEVRGPDALELVQELTVNDAVAATASYRFAGTIEAGERHAFDRVGDVAVDAREGDTAVCSVRFDAD